jgi:hypothetical protein
VQSDQLILLLILIVSSIGTIIYRYYLPRIKGAKGERRVARQLRRLNKKEYTVLNDIYLKKDDQTTQIDHLILSIYGIFVIETKNYDGWIHGSEKSEYWKQTFYKEKERFRNPVKQNWAHIFFLKDVLSNYYPVKYHSIIVFAGNAELKNVYSSVPVIYKKELLKTIRQYKTPSLSIDQVERLRAYLSDFMIDKKKGEKEHKKYLKRYIKNRKKSIKSSICPNCGGELKVRKGRYGKFYGCSNFPECRFSKKV